jgi:hypothetical protein
MPPVTPTATRADTRPSPGAFLRRTSTGVGLPRSDGQGWWLGQATCLMTSSWVVVSNSSGSCSPGHCGVGCRCTRRCTRRCTPRWRGGPRLGSARTAGQALTLQGREERLGQRVVPALPRAATRQDDRQVVGEPGVVAAGVLATAVGMEHHSGCGITGGDRVGQRIGDQLGAQLLGQGEPDHPTGGDVDHGGEIQPAFPGREGGVGVGPGRPARLSPGGFPRPALRTGRATLPASGSPRGHAAGAGGPVVSLGHGVGILAPR